MAALENDYIIYMKQMKDLRMDQTYITIEPYLRGVRNLLGKSQHTSCLPEAEEKIAEYRKMGSAAEGMQHEAQLWLKVFFGEDEQGANITLQISKDGVKTSEAGLQFLMLTFPHVPFVLHSAQTNETEQVLETGQEASPDYQNLGEGRKSQSCFCRADPQCRSCLGRREEQGRDGKIRSSLCICGTAWT